MAAFRFPLQIRLGTQCDLNNSNLIVRLCEVGRCVWLCLVSKKAQEEGTRNYIST